MLTLVVLLFVLIVFDIAAMLWGFNSGDGPHSSEWERRQQRAWPEEDLPTEPILPLTPASCSHHCS